MAKKYLSIVAGKIKEVIGAVVATANSLVSTGADGRIHISFMPDGVAAEVVVAVTSDNLAAGDFVNLYLNGGVNTIGKADASTNAKPAHGFVTAVTTAPAVATMYLLGVNNSFVTGVVTGSNYALSKTTPAGVTELVAFVAARVTGNNL